MLERILRLVFFMLLIVCMMLYYRLYAETSNLMYVMEIAGIGMLAGAFVVDKGLTSLALVAISNAVMFLAVIPNGDLESFVYAALAVICGVRMFDFWRQYGWY